ncbi:MAG: hypothetical protein R2728_05560 [Chitinophagales bacterium]
MSALGCDSIVTVNTSLLVASFNTINVESCDPSEVGTTIDTLIAANGCDSIVTVNTSLANSFVTNIQLQVVTLLILAQ